MPSPKPITSFWLSTKVALLQHKQQAITNTSKIEDGTLISSRSKNCTPLAHWVGWLTSSPTSTATGQRNRLRPSRNGKTGPCPAAVRSTTSARI